MTVSRQHLPPYRILARAQVSELRGQSIRRVLALNRQRLRLTIRSAQQHGGSSSIDPRAELHGDRYVRTRHCRIDRGRGLDQHRVGQRDTRNQHQRQCDGDHQRGSRHNSSNGTARQVFHTLLDTPPYQRVQKTQSRSRDGDLSCTSTSINCQRNFFEPGAFYLAATPGSRTTPAPSPHP